MVRFAEETRAPEVLVATEVGILHRMRRLNPTTKFTPISEGTICPYMKEIDLTDVRDSLALNQFVIDVPDETARRGPAARSTGCSPRSPASSSECAGISGPIPWTK